MFEELYFLRWPIEIKFLELKEFHKMEEWNGATTSSIFQEFYIGLLLANLCSLIKNSADEEINSSTKPASKNRYQSNRAFIIGRLKKLLPRMLFLDNDIGLMIDELISIASKYRSQIQPNRSTYRKKSNKGRTHFRNRKYTY